MDGLTKIKGSACRKRVIEVIFDATLWHIWKARNSVIFEGNQFNAGKVVEDIKEDSFMWIKYRSKSSGLVWERWRDFNVSHIFL
ncbi:hypothetical protein Hanom_Chr14g01253641 [Helianthus anomalus]